jgi:hypothetical protein
VTAIFFKAYLSVQDKNLKRGQGEGSIEVRREPDKPS